MRKTPPGAGQTGSWRFTLRTTSAGGKLPLRPLRAPAVSGSGRAVLRTEIVWRLHLESQSRGRLTGVAHKRATKVGGFAWPCLLPWPHWQRLGPAACLGPADSLAPPAKARPHRQLGPLPYPMTLTSTSEPFIEKVEAPAPFAEPVRSYPTPWPLSWLPYGS